MADATTILTVIGARPQFIKAATVSRAISGRADMREILVHTGQHYDANMSDTFFEELAIPVPGHNLNIGSGPHGAQTGAMLEAIERVLLQEKPDWLLVYGDTNSTIAGALAAAKLHVPVAHVEAGMRSFNRRMPEELNRVLTDHLSTLNLTSTQTATEHLASEGISGDRVLEVGDVMYDAARFYGERAGDRAALLDRLDVKSGDFLLATVHRAENTDDPRRMDAIIEAFISLGESHRIVLPLHPRTRAVLEQRGDYLRSDGLGGVFDGLPVPRWIGFIVLPAAYLLMAARFVVAGLAGFRGEQLGGLGELGDLDLEALAVDVPSDDATEPATGEAVDA